MTTLPVRELVLYKNGVGFFVRQGEVSGTEVRLNFRADEINDILKSLAIFDHTGGKILGIHYQTPMEQDTRLASSSIRLSQNASIRDLIRDLRGRMCAFRFTDRTDHDIYGQVVGLDEGVALQEEPRIAFLTDDGVQIESLQKLKTVRILDTQSEHDLGYFLETSMSEDERRIVTAELSAGEHNLAVYYVAPSPVWRISYRLVADAAPDQETGTALLQGWGIFDNRFDEDLQDVRVTFVAGQPISFIYDLYRSFIPQRRLIQDQEQSLPGPVEYAADSAAMEFMSDFAPEPARAGAALMKAAPRMRRANASVDVSVDTKSAGDIFQYAVTTPVNVKRGESAMVPILQNTVSYARELLYNRAKLADHPVVAIRFPNDTGLKLERGPVTVVEDGDYRGEAIIPFTTESSSVYIPFAVELGITIREEASSETRLAGLRFDKGNLFEQLALITTTRFLMDNKTERKQIVTIEVPQPPAGTELYESLEPEIRTLQEWRWRIPADAGQVTVFTLRTRTLRHQAVQWRDITGTRLAQYLKGKWLEDEVYGRLRTIVDMQQSLESVRAELETLRQKQAAVYAQQDQIRQNLMALQQAGEQGELRNRILLRLSQAQDELDRIDQSISEGEATLIRLDQQIKQEIATL